MRASRSLSSALGKSSPLSSLSVLRTLWQTLVDCAHRILCPIQQDCPELFDRSLRKTSHILLALSDLVNGEPSSPPVTYYALDLEKPELERTLSELAASDVGSKLQGKVAIKGMWGTYDGGLKFIQEGGIHGRDAASQMEQLTLESLRDMSPASHKDSESSGTRSSEHGSGSDVITTPSTPDTPQTPLHILFLGSSIGNFPRDDGTDFLRGLPLRPGSGDTLLLGIDHNIDPVEIEQSYNDSLGITRRFIIQGKSSNLVDRHGLTPR